MGLDMYLSKKTYVKRWNPDTGKSELTGTIDVSNIDAEKVTYITEDVGYWRKANAIHRWFVEHVQDGEDDCKPYWVSREQLAELLEAVNQVLASAKLVKGQVTNGYTFKDGKMEPILQDGETMADPSVAEDLLPTQAGFFFGSTDYDQWYVDDLKETQRMLSAALADDSDGEFYYQASW
jgi:hypothetical protein